MLIWLNRCSLGPVSSFSFTSMEIDEAGILHVSRRREASGTLLKHGVVPDGRVAAGMRRRRACFVHIILKRVVPFFAGQRSRAHPARTPATSASSPSPWSRATSLWSWTSRRLKGWVAGSTRGTAPWLHCCCVITHTCSFKTFSCSRDLH